MRPYEMLIKKGTVVIPYVGVTRADIAVNDGRIAAVADSIATSQSEDVIDATGKLVLPGAIDSHFHVGIYRPFDMDAESESRSALIGGVTTILSYFRTGHHYLNRTGPYARIFPELLKLAKGHFYTDYGFHLAIMTAEQLEEVDTLVHKFGVGSFKFYMFYKGLNLSASSTDGAQYTMSENYDLGHLFMLMEKVAEVSHAFRGRGRIALSLHCENAELIRVFIEKVKKEGLKGLEAYSASRPPLSEHLSILEAVLLAQATSCPINLLHLSSAEALQAAIDARRQHPALSIVLETTLHHLCLTHEGNRHGNRAKVNPPIRSDRDVRFLWKGIVDGEVDTVVSDHACCMEEEKKGSLWESLPGFAGSSLLYPILISEGFHKRNIPITRIAELASANPARHFGLYPQKGAINVGSDADFCILDPGKRQVIVPELLQSAQPYSPFAAMRIQGWPTEVVVRGQVLIANCRLGTGKPTGQYLRRPYSL